MSRRFCFSRLFLLDNSVKWFFSLLRPVQDDIFFLMLWLPSRHLTLEFKEEPNQCFISLQKSAQEAQNQSTHWLGKLPCWKVQLRLLVPQRRSSVAGEEEDRGPTLGSFLFPQVCRDKTNGQEEQLPESRGRPADFALSCATIFNLCLSRSWSCRVADVTCWLQFQTPDYLFPSETEASRSRWGAETLKLRSVSFTKGLVWSPWQHAIFTLW